MLYGAVAETYRALYEVCFTGLAPFTQFAQFPARAVVRLLPDRPTGPTSAQVYWEIVDEWADVHPRVTAGFESPHETIEELGETAKADCARLQRPFIDFTFSQGRVEWNAWEPAVSNEVQEMILHDLQRIEHWLASAS